MATNTFKSGWLLFICFTFVYCQNCSNYYTCQLNLYDRLLANSRPSIRPVERDSQKIDVRVGFSLIRLVSINEEDSLITIRAHLNQTWNASVLGWDATKYADVQHFRVPAHSIWTPKVELLNPSATIDTEMNHFVNVQSNGRFELSYSTLLTSPCNFDMKGFPFDQQTCTFRIGSSLYDINEVEISEAIDVVIDEPSLMPNGYYFVSHAIDKNSTFFAGFERTYEQVSIQLNIHRRSTFCVRLFNWPSSILISLALAIFLLPPSAPERIYFSAVLLLCHFILLTTFAFYVPKRLGASWPWMGHTICYDIFLTTLVILFSVLTRLLSDGQSYSSERPSAKMRSLFFGHLMKLLGLRRLSYTALVTNHENDYSANESATNDAAMEPLTSFSNGSTVTSDSLVSTSNTMSRDIAFIKQKLGVFLNQHNVHQEWILLAHVVNRLCLVVYIFFFSISIGNHLFHA